MKKKIRWKNLILTVLVFCLLIGAGLCIYEKTRDLFFSQKVQSNTNFDTLEKATTSKTHSMIQQIYDVNYSKKIYLQIQAKKKSHSYDENNMLLIHNPYGTNTLSIYVYFKTKTAYQTSYKIEVQGIEDYHAVSESRKTKSHEFQIIGLIPDKKNTITITLKNNKKTIKKTFTCTAGSLLGNEQKSFKITASFPTKLSNGLCAILGNDTSNLDFIYYYDNYGNIRGEIPIIDYRACNLLFKNQTMYYSISKEKLAGVNKLGQVVSCVTLKGYELHHDYAFMGDDLVALATKENAATREDCIIKISLSENKIIDTFDMEEVLADYKKTCKNNDAHASGTGMDWVHLNTIQVTDDDTVIISLRETSTIMKISHLFSQPTIQYMIGESSFWKGTGYSSYLYQKLGSFSSAGGQHAVNYESIKGSSSYYLTMFNNNIGLSTSQPDYDWTQIAGIQLKTNAHMTTTQLKSASSYYYKYLVDETTRTYTLVKKIAVPYSVYVSSSQDYKNHEIVDSGYQGLFGEYDSSGQLIRQFKMKLAGLSIYRVYKYDFKGYYFN